MIMTYKTDALSILNFIAEHDNRPKEEYDTDRLHPKPFTQKDDYIALFAGAFCMGLTVIIIYFIR